MAIKVTIQELDVVAQQLQDGKIVAFPTDTVYGLACRSDSQELLERLRRVKGRPEEKPFPIVVGSIEQCEDVAIVDQRALQIMSQWWPGALTLVLNKKSKVEDWATQGRSTIAVRMLDEEGISEMIKNVGVPLFLTSANRSSDPVCKTGDEVMGRLGERIDVVVDGKHQDNLASTILDCTQEKLSVLREGKISLEEIEKSIRED
ncbi:MAG: L-threonylcarbamoyladenylate synthase [Anaerorhabdus sp.]